jgi:hypothetical protein
MGQLTNALDAVAALGAFELGTITLLIAILLAVGMLVVRQREHHEVLMSLLDRLEGNLLRWINVTIGSTMTAASDRCRQAPARAELAVGHSGS